MKIYETDYSQPDFYHFTEDSIALARSVCQLTRDRQNISCLDLCAGCGVVGLEIWHKRKDFRFDFCEQQSEFASFFEVNCERMKAGSAARWINASFLQLRSEEFAKKYDLIVSNPPYFVQQKARLGKDHRRNVCRFFMGCTQQELLETMLFCLKDCGVAYFLTREFPAAFTSAKLELIKQFRGALLVSLSHLDKDRG